MPYLVYKPGDAPATATAPARTGPVVPAPKEFKGHDDMVQTLAFSADGVLLASGSRDKTLRVWDVATAAEGKAVAHAGPVWNAVWVADGRVVTTSGPGREGGGKLSWIDPVTGTFARSYAATTGTVRALAAARDGGTVAWLKGGQLELIPARLRDPEGAFFTERRNVFDAQHLAVTPDGKKVLLASDSRCRVWEPHTGQPPKAFRHVVQDVTGVAVAGNGLYALSTTRGAISLIDPDTLDLVENVRDLPSSGAFGVAVSPDGKHIASAMENGVRVFDPKTRQEVGRFAAPAGVKFQATCVAYSPDGAKVAAGGGFTVFENPRNFTIYLWDVTGMTPPPAKKD